MKGIHSFQSIITALFISVLFAFSANALSADTKSVEEGSQPVKQHASNVPVGGLINLNKADVQTLAQLNGIGEKKAEAIIAYRQSIGGFKSVDDLLNVKGIGEKTLEKNRARLTVN